MHSIKKLFKSKMLFKDLVNEVVQTLNIVDCPLPVLSLPKMRIAVFSSQKMNRVVFYKATHSSGIEECLDSLNIYIYLQLLKK